MLAINLERYACMNPMGCSSQYRCNKAVEMTTLSCPRPAPVKASSWTRVAALLATGMLLCACASSGADQPPSTVDKGAPPEVASAAKPPADAPGPPAESDEIAYKVWAAEVYGAEGDFDQAAREYLGAALLSSDPEISRRATEVAISAQAWEIATMTADRWVLLQPENLQARQTATRTLLVSGDLVRAELQITELLRLLADEPWAGWEQVGPLLSAARDADRTDRMVQRLIEETGAQRNPYALLARSQVLARGGQFDEALVLAREAAGMAPAEAGLQSWAGRLSLSQRDEQGAREYYRAAWQSDPQDRSLALIYAELLRQTGAPEDAIDVLASLPDTPENRFTQVAFATESGNRELAEDLYAGFSETPYEDVGDAAFQAARSAEVLDLKEEAIGWYAQLDGGDNALIATLRQAILLSELGRVDEAREQLLYARNDGSTMVQMETTLIEAQILSEAGQGEEAFRVLAKALGQFPGDERLLYTRALIAVQLDRLEQAEADLREVLGADPSNAAALNALGYTLADRTSRLDEAEALIRQAYQLEPEDPAIIDSMGWVAYRQGRLDDAEQYLRQAFMRDRNAEIGAHLAEVLYVMGRDDEARAILNQARRIDPDHPVLLETLERLGITL